MLAVFLVAVLLFFVVFPCSVDSHSADLYCLLENTSYHLHFRSWKRVTVTDSSLSWYSLNKLAASKDVWLCLIRTDTHIDTHVPTNKKEKRREREAQILALFLLEWKKRTFSRRILFWNDPMCFYIQFRNSFLCLWRSVQLGHAVNVQTPSNGIAHLSHASVSWTSKTSKMSQRVSGQLRHLTLLSCTSIASDCYSWN